MTHDLLTTDEVAAYLGQKRRTLEDWRVRGVGPTFVRFTGRGVRYRRSDVEAFLRERSFTSTADAAARTADRVEREQQRAADTRNAKATRSRGRGTAEARARRRRPAPKA